jgi:hypothetical protein
MRDSGSFEMGLHFSAKGAGCEKEGKQRCGLWGKKVEAKSQKGM